MTEFHYWQSTANRWWYWHLAYSGTVRATGGQGYASAQLAVNEINLVFRLLGGTANIPIRQIADPQAA